MTLQPVLLKRDVNLDSTLRCAYDGYCSRMTWGRGMCRISRRFQCPHQTTEHRTASRCIIRINRKRKSCFGKNHCWNNVRAVCEVAVKCRQEQQMRIFLTQK